MILLNLFSEHELPKGFKYPTEFKRVLQMGLTNIEPWYFLEGKQLREVFNGLAERYPERKLLPFARRQDNDDIACWQIDLGNQDVFVIHDYASPGWEHVGCSSGFYNWFRQAIEDFIDFDC